MVIGQSRSYGERSADRASTRLRGGPRAAQRLLRHAVTAMLLAVSGCEREAGSPGPADAKSHSQGSSAHHDHTRHDHDHDHDHSHGHEQRDEKPDAAAVGAGASSKDADSHGHAHDVKPQRGGLVVALGDHLAHAEITVDRPTGRITLYVMDCDARAIRLAQEEVLIKFRPPAPEPDFELPLLPVEDSLTGEKKGDTSAFSIRCDELERLKKFDATITQIKIKGVELKNVSFSYAAP